RRQGHPRTAEKTAFRCGGVVRAARRTRRSGFPPRRYSGRSAARTGSPCLLRQMICLDTNIAIHVINRRVPAIRLRLAEQLRLGTEIGFPAIALFELRYGHARSDRPAESDRLLAEFLAPGIAVLP